MALVRTRNSPRLNLLRMLTGTPLISNVRSPFAFLSAPVFRQLFGFPVSCLCQLPSAYQDISLSRQSLVTNRPRNTLATMGANDKPLIAFFGATGGCCLAALTRTLQAGYPCAACKYRPQRSEAFSLGPWRAASFKSNLNDAPRINCHPVIKAGSTLAKSQAVWLVAPTNSVPCSPTKVSPTPPSHHSSPSSKATSMTPPQSPRYSLTTTQRPQSLSAGSAPTLHSPHYSCLSPFAPMPPNPSSPLFGT